VVSCLIFIKYYSHQKNSSQSLKGDLPKKKNKKSNSKKQGNTSATDDDTTANTTDDEGAIEQ